MEVYTHGNASVQFPLDVPFERTVLERRIMLRIREIGWPGNGLRACYRVFSSSCNGVHEAEWTHPVPSRTGS
jgi:hypothetical protein